MKKFALIVAGGSGNRMSSFIPKQFMELSGKPILMHTLQAFVNADPDFIFIVVLPESQTGYWEKLCIRYDFKIKHTLVPGGTTRFHSVKNGLEKINDEGIVFIHDGVRPLVSAQTIENCCKIATEKGNSLPVIAPAESIRKVEKNMNYAVDRSKYFLVQTPQTFKVSVIKEAFKQDYSEKFTDDASVLENTGQKIYLVEGNRENIKITFPEDIKLAEIYCSTKK